MGKASLFSFLFLLSSSYLLAGDDLATTPADALLVFKEANKELTRLNSALPVCDLSKEKNCEQGEFCDFLSQNKNNYQIYKNDEGEYIPNISLYGIDAIFKTCSQASSQINTNVYLPPKINQGKIEQAKLHKAFLESIKKNNEQAIMSQLEFARSEILLEKAEKGTDLDDFTRYQTLQDPQAGKDLIAKELSEVESKAGVKLSQESRDKYIAFNSYVPPISGMGMGAGMGQGVGSSFEDVWKSPAADPFMDSSLLTFGSETEVKEQQAKYQSRLDKTYETFLEAQKDLITFIESKKDKLGSKVVESILERLKTVNFNDDTNGPMCSTPNAFYNPQDHKITVCRQLLMLPKESIKAILAHELGHSFDPCMISSNLVKAGEGIQNPYGNTFASVGLKFKPKNYKESENSYLADVLEMLPSDLEVQAKGVSFNSNPFSPVISCLATQKSMGARLPDYATLERNLNLSIDEMEAGGATKKNSPEYAQLLKTKSNFKNLVKSKYACSFIPGTGFTEVQEAFADWVAGEVVASDLAKAKPEKKRSMAFESMAFFLGMDCKNLAPELSDSTKAALKSCNKQGTSMVPSQGIGVDVITLSGVAQRSSDPHPRTFKRIDNLFMAQPEIREAMGCNSGFKGLLSKGALHCEL